MNRIMKKKLQHVFGWLFTIFGGVNIIIGITRLDDNVEEATVFILFLGGAIIGGICMLKTLKPKEKIQLKGLYEQALPLYRRTVMIVGKAFNVFGAWMISASKTNEDKSFANSISNHYKDKVQLNKAMELLSIAKDGIGVLVSGYKRLPRKGLCEVILFNTNFVLNSEWLINSPQKRKIVDDYCSILYHVIEEEMPNASPEELASFISGRLSFYMEEYNKLMNERLYTAMFIYSNFYVNPLHKNSPIGTTNTLELLSFTKALYDMIGWINKQIN